MVTYVNPQFFEFLKFTGICYGKPLQFSYTQQLASIEAATRIWHFVVWEAQPPLTGPLDTTLSSCPSFQFYCNDPYCLPVPAKAFFPAA